MSKTGNWGDKIIIVLHPQDEKRNRKWCENYRSSDGGCYKRVGKCTGSAHCKLYVAMKQNNTITFQKQTAKTKKVCEKSFKGIQLIDMADVVVPKHFATIPNAEKVSSVIEFYREHGTLDKPILVKCESGKYILEDKYLRYYVAKELGLKQIHAKVGKKAQNKLEDEIRKRGTILNHKTLGKVIVSRSDLKHVVVKDAFDREIVLDIETCLEEKLFKFER